MGQEDDGMYIRNARTEHQYMIASIELPGQDFSVSLPRQDFQDMTSRIEESEHILL
jgi:hypothetical protein